MGYEDVVDLEDGREANMVTVSNNGSITTIVSMHGEEVRKWQYCASMSVDREHESQVWKVEDGELGVRGASTDSRMPLRRLADEQDNLLAGQARELLQAFERPTQEMQFRDDHSLLPTTSLQGKVEAVERRSLLLLALISVEDSNAREMEWWEFATFLANLERGFRMVRRLVPELIQEDSQNLLPTTFTLLSKAMGKLIQLQNATYEK